MKSIFEFFDYKLFVMAFETNKKSLIKGFRSKLAMNLNCQSAFITQVLNGNGHFSPEQSLKCSRFLGLSSNEERYFLLLNQYNRAGTVDLEKFYKVEVDQMREQFFNLENRITTTNTLSEEVKNQYYSSWHYAIIHMLITINKYQTVEAIQQVLKLSKTQIQSILLFLTHHGLVKEKSSGLFVIGEAQIHLSKNSSLVKQHHQNVRLKILDSFHSENYNEDLHYSAISSLSEKDFETIKVLFLKTIEDYVKIIGPSKEETLAAFTLDFIRLV